METDPISIPALAQLVGQLQQNLENANAEINNHREQLGAAAQKVAGLEAELASARNGTRDHQNPKKNKPSSFNGKGSVSSWCVQMDNYLGQDRGMESLYVALSYLSGSAHEWWIVHEKSPEGQNIRTWGHFKDALVQRFETLNKEKIARDKLAKWRQVKDVTSFNEDFNKILLDIPEIGPKDQIDRYSRGLKPYIWKALCTKEYENLTDLMRDAERVEAAYRRSGLPQVGSRSTVRSNGSSGGNGPVPMEIGNIGMRQSNYNQGNSLQKLSKEERERCMKEGLCLRCRQKGHMARNCPKGRRN